VRSTEEERVYGETRSGAIQGWAQIAGSAPAPCCRPPCPNLPQPFVKLVPIIEGASQERPDAEDAEVQRRGRESDDASRPIRRVDDGCPSPYAEYISTVRVICVQSEYASSFSTRPSRPFDPACEMEMRRSESSSVRRDARLFPLGHALLAPERAQRPATLLRWLRPS
jgi:hypothetical protein